jgi:single-strand selective monofunctional uracil DNA glycosylase
MAQTGIPFGEVETVRTWLGIDGTVGVPSRVHPKRPIEGFACTRSEVSGRRLWGLFRDRFERAEEFFSRHLVINYCPLAYMEESGKNLTPDKLKRGHRDPLFRVCDGALRSTCAILQPEYIVGVGAFARGRLQEAEIAGARVVQILHPSPASPAANRGWSDVAERQLIDAGVWNPR